MSSYLLSSRPMRTLFGPWAKRPSLPDGVLAKGFSLRAGTVSFQVPFIPSTILNADEKHQIILFGDSGNISPPFTIKFDPKVFVSEALGQ
ncbi:hypothetical protein H0H93_010676 [Arthromyces matolae]|nr:hypothetical protein H0H93_010676 [Arthromyces matolae]